MKPIAGLSDAKPKTVGAKVSTLPPLDPGQPQVPALNNAEEERRESQSGIHYIELYNSCQRKHYLTYNMGLAPKALGKALIFGGAFHEAKATFYDTAGDVKKAIEVGMKDIIDRRDKFISVDDYEFSLGRMEPLFRAWAGEFGDYDLNTYEILGTEEEFRIPVPFTPDYMLTQRHDALVRHKETRKIYTMETKTASSSVNFTMDSVRDSSQVIGYNWGGQQVFGSDYGGLIIDVAYWSSKSKNPGTIKCVRSEPILKGVWDTKKLQADAAALFNELEAKQKSLASGTPPEFLYRRNSYFCHSFFTPCPFLSICNKPAKEILKTLPEHLEVTDQVRRIDGMTYDSIYYSEG